MIFRPTVLRSLLLALTLAAPLGAVADVSLHAAVKRPSAEKRSEKGKTEAPRAQALSEADEIKIQAAAYLFLYYNKKLDPQKAKEYGQHVLEASKRYSLDYALVSGIIIKESTANAQCRGKYAVGLMQIYWRLHKKTIMQQFPHITSARILMEPRNNIMVGCWLFQRYLTYSKGDVTKALHRYLGAKGDKYVKQIRKYRQRCLGREEWLLQRADTARERKRKAL